MKKLLMSVIGIIFSLTANAQGNFIPKKQTFVHESSKKYGIGGYPNPSTQLCLSQENGLNL